MKFDPNTDIPDLAGKVILVTGGNAGLGAATVQALAAHNPGRIYLCCRRKASGEELVSEIHQSHPDVDIVVTELDLKSFESIKRCAAEVNASTDRLDILYNNAGVSSTLPALTQDGYEEQFGVNHMAHALLTQLLLPKMLETQRSKDADVRIVNVSSNAASILQPKGGLLLDKAKTTMADVHTFKRYGHSKFANVLFARKLSQVYPNITSVSLHPGAVRTKIWDQATGAKMIMSMFKPLTYFMGVDLNEGVKTQLWCGVASGVKNGQYYEPTAKEACPHKSFVDQELTDQLWAWTDTELRSHGAPGWPTAQPEAVAGQA